jgi:DNA (cytosine-5)-methyltransferase 1
MMRSGTVFQLPPLVRLTDATGSGSLLPTPTETANMLAPSMQKWPAHRNIWPTPRAEFDSGKHNGKPDTLHSAVKMWPTPTSRDWKDGSAQACANVPSNSLLGREVHTDGMNSSGSLNPAWVEFLMGFPLGWTALDHSATPSSRKSRKS